MIVMTIEDQIKLIVRQQTGRSEVDDETPLRWDEWLHVNDEVCLALNLNIGTAEASKCRTVSNYIKLVRSKR